MTEVNFIKPTKEEIIAYFEGKGLKAKFYNDQVVTNMCPFCPVKKEDWTHFYIEPGTGLFYCHKCGERGNMIKIAKHYGDFIPGKRNALDLNKPINPPELARKEEPSSKEKETTPEEIARYTDSADIYHENLLKAKPGTLEEKVLNYLLQERGFTLDILKHFNIGWTGNSISIPLVENGKVINIKTRRNPFDNSDRFPKFKNIPGAKTGLFNGDVLVKQSKIVITEGEFDAMTLYQQGWEGVISIGCGSKAFKHEWAIKLATAKSIYLCYDNDPAGQEGVERAIERLGASRCYRLVLPKKDGEKKKDLNEFFVKDKKTIDDFNALYNKAEKIKVNYEFIEHIKTIAKSTKEMITNPKYVRGLKTGYPALDRQFGGMRKGDLIVISAATSIGKTFFTQNILYQVAKGGIPDQKAIKTMFFSLEQPTDEIVERFMMIDQSESFFNVDLFTPKMVSKIEVACENLGKMPIYFYSGADRVDTKLLGEVAIKAVKDFGAELIAIDHLHYFLSGDRKNRVAEVGDITRYLKLLARQLKVPIILICHLKKLENEKVIPNIYDLKDSSGIGQDADIVVLLHRERVSKMDRRLKANCIANVDKNRHGKTGQVDFNFNDDKCLFIEGKIAEPSLPDLSNPDTPPKALQELPVKYNVT